MCVGDKQRVMQAVSVCAASMGVSCELVLVSRC